MPLPVLLHLYLFSLLSCKPLLYLNGQDVIFSILQVSEMCNQVCPSGIPLLEMRDLQVVSREKINGL